MFKPKAGQYKENFSPYLMTNHKFLCISRNEASDDLMLLTENAKNTSCSVYFYERDTGKTSLSPVFYYHNKKQKKVKYNKIWSFPSV